MTAAIKKLTFAEYLKYDDGTEAQYEYSRWRINPHEPWYWQARRNFQVSRANL